MTLPLGAGTSPAGFGPAGAAPIVIVAPSTAPPQPTARLFDLGTRSFPIAANGSLATTHYVDQQVNLALGIEVGSVASVGTFGQTIRRIQRLSGPRLQSQVNDAVNVALALLLRNGDIRLLGVAIDTSVRGRLVVAVSYLNLRLQNAQKQTATFTSGG